MSDERLRELELCFNESGAIEDEAAWLRERVRKGGLLEENLKFAAECGHAASRMILGHTWSKLISLDKLAEEKVQAPGRVGLHIGVCIRNDLEIDSEIQAGFTEFCVRAIQYLLYPSPVDGRGYWGSLEWSLADLHRLVSQLNSDAYWLNEDLSLTDLTHGMHIKLAEELVDALSFTYFLGDKINPLKKVIKTASTMFGEKKEEAFLEVRTNLARWALGYNDPLVDLIAKFKEDQSD